MADKYIRIDANNNRAEIEATVASAGAGNAGDIVALAADGRLDPTVLPAGVGADTKSIQASEALAAGDFVTIHNASGARVRKADASDGETGRADGFVKDNVTSGNMATVYFEGPNSGLTGLTPGTEYALSATTPGGVVTRAAALTTPGYILQTLGIATEATEINVELGDIVVRG